MSDNNLLKPATTFSNELSACFKLATPGEGESLYSYLSSFILKTVTNPTRGRWISPEFIRHFLNRKIPAAGVPDRFKKMCGNTTWFMNFGCYDSVGGALLGRTYYECVRKFLDSNPCPDLDSDGITSLLCAAHAFHDARVRFTKNRNEDNEDTMKIAFLSYIRTYKALSLTESHQFNQDSVIPKHITFHSTVPVGTHLACAQELFAIIHSTKFASAKDFYHNPYFALFNAYHGRLGFSGVKYWLMQEQNALPRVREVSWHLTIDEWKELSINDIRAMVTPDTACFGHGDNRRRNRNPKWQKAFIKNDDFAFIREVLKVDDGGKFALMGSQSYAVAVDNAPETHDFDIATTLPLDTAWEYIEEIIEENNIPLHVTEQKKTRISFLADGKPYQLFRMRNFAECINFHFDYARSYTVYDGVSENFVIWGWPSFWLFVDNNINLFIRYVTGSKNCLRLIIEKFFIADYGKIHLNDGEIALLRQYFLNDEGYSIIAQHGQCLEDVLNITSSFTIDDDCYPHVKAIEHHVKNRNVLELAWNYLLFDRIAQHSFIRMSLFKRGVKMIFNDKEYQDEVNQSSGKVTESFRMKSFNIVGMNAPHSFDACWDYPHTNNTWDHFRGDIKMSVHLLNMGYHQVVDTYLSRLWNLSLVCESINSNFIPDNVSVLVDDSITDDIPLTDVASLSDSE